MNVLNNIQTTLIDVKGNVDGGYGIFTGISCVTKSVKVS